MSIITALFDKSAYGYEEAFRAVDKTSAYMKKAIIDWFDLYYLKEPTDEEDPCQEIPGTIVRKLTKTAFSEYNANSEDEFVTGILDTLDQKKVEAMQLALIGGECLLKPVPLPKEGSWRWTVIARSNILVFGRDADGRMTDIGTAERTAGEKSYYTLLERRTVDANGYLTAVTERTKIEKYEGGIHYTEDGGESWTDLAENTTVSMNMWGFTGSFIEEIEARFPAFLDSALESGNLRAEFFLPGTVSQLLSEGKAAVKVLTSPDKWYGVTYAADKPMVVAALKAMTDSGLYPTEGLWSK